MALLKQITDRNNDVKSYEMLDHQLEKLKLEVSKLKKEIEILKRPKHIIVSLKGTKKVIMIDEIVMIEAQSNYSRIHTITHEVILTSKTLKHWHAKMSSHNFIRSHSAFLINLDFIEHVDMKRKTIQMSNDLIANLSREGARRAKEWFMSQESKILIF